MEKVRDYIQQQETKTVGINEIAADLDLKKRDVIEKLRQYLQYVMRKHPEGLTITDLTTIMKINRNWIAKQLDLLYLSGKVERKHIGPAREKYAAFVEDGISQGKRNELTGGGLIRSIGGWKVLNDLRSMNIKLHSDERILGDSDFVGSVLKDAEEALDRKHQYKKEGFGFDEALHLAANIYRLEVWEIVAAGKQPLRVKARSLLCYWAVRELGESVTSVASRLGLTSAVSRAVHRGERLVLDQNYTLETLRKVQNQERYILLIYMGRPFETGRAYGGCRCADRCY